MEEINEDVITLQFWNDAAQISKLRMIIVNLLGAGAFS